MSWTIMNVFQIIIGVAAVAGGVYFVNLWDATAESNSDRTTFKALALALFAIGAGIVGFAIGDVTDTSETTAAAATATATATANKPSTHSASTTASASTSAGVAGTTGVQPVAGVTQS